MLLNDELRVKVKFYVESEFLEVLQNNLLLGNGGTSSKLSLKNNLCDRKGKEEKILAVESHRVALYIFIQEWWQAEKRGELIVNKLVSRFENGYKIKISHATIKRWVEKPKINSKYRAVHVQIKALSILIDEVCEMKNVKKEYKVVTTMLNELVQSGKYNFNYTVTFSEHEVETWIMTNKHIQH